MLLLHLYVHCESEAFCVTSEIADVTTDVICVEAKTMLWALKLVFVRKKWL